jgi:hypothetical protein
MSMLLGIWLTAPVLKAYWCQGTYCFVHEPGSCSGISQSGYCTLICAGENRSLDFVIYCNNHDDEEEWGHEGDYFLACACGPLM